MDLTGVWSVHSNGSISSTLSNFVPRFCWVNPRFWDLGSRQTICQIATATMRLLIYLFFFFWKKLATARWNILVCHLRSQSLITSALCQPACRESVRV